MLYEIMRHLYGTMAYRWPITELYGGEFEVKNGGIELPFLLDGQYFRIVGSVFNDGVYQYPATELKDEKFCGAIWALAIEPAFLDLVEKIEAWETENRKKNKGIYQSESFAGYSYTLKTGRNGRAYSWKDEFYSDLQKWRKI